MLSSAQHLALDAGLAVNHDVDGFLFDPAEDADVIAECLTSGALSSTYSAERGESPAPRAYNRKSLVPQFSNSADDFDDEDLDDEFDGDVTDGDTAAAPAPRVKNANLSNRLPREDFAIVVPFDDRAPLMERCADVLKERLVERRGLGFFLDRRPATVAQIVEAAGLKFKDEEGQQFSPPPRKRKRRRKVA